MKNIAESYVQGRHAADSYWHRYYSVTEEEMEVLKKQYPDKEMGKVHLAPKYHNYDYGHAEKAASGLEGYGLGFIRLTSQTYCSYILESSVRIL